MKFVFDLDGTICFKGKRVTDKISDALLQLTADGHEVIFASARPIRDMLPVLREDFHKYTMIGGNGSLLSIQGKVVKSYPFSAVEMKEILQLIEEFDASYLIDGDWDYAYTGTDHHPILQNLDPAKLAKLVTVDDLPSIVKILILTSRNQERFAEKLTSLDVHVHIHGNENVLDISPQGVHKWSALEALGVEANGFIAFGNDANDVTMFEHAKHSVMIGSHEKLKELAKEAMMVDDFVGDRIVEKLQALSKRYNVDESLKSK